MKNELTAIRLRKALSKVGMIPQELSERSGVSKASISQYMNGSHSPSNISSGKIGAVLGVNPLWLMGFDVSMETVPPEADNSPYSKTPIKSDEYNIIEKYRVLDSHGKEMVDFTLEKEWERSTAVTVEKESYKEPLLMAAHNDAETTDEELEKMKRDFDKF